MAEVLPHRLMLSKFYCRKSQHSSISFRVEEQVAYLRSTDREHSRSNHSRKWRSPLMDMPMGMALLRSLTPRGASLSMETRCMLH